MDKTYRKIVDFVKSYGIKSELEKQEVKVVDLENSILVLHEKSGWLALRKPQKTTSLSNQSHVVYFNKVLYKGKYIPYCLKYELEKVEKMLHNI